MTRIAVVRALHLGDMLCAVPALRSLRASTPNAEITLIGLPWARELASRLTSYIDRFEEFPGFPGIPERTFDAAHITQFLHTMQARAFDLAVQLHGSGSHINEFTALLGADRTAVFYRPGDFVPNDRDAVPWPERGSEVHRLLAMTQTLGCPDRGTALEFGVTQTDHSALAELLEGLLASALLHHPYVCLHPGARFPSRRWSAERFAVVGDMLAEHGMIVVLTGTANEAPLTNAVRDHMRAPATDLTGQLSLGTLAALVQNAALVVCNDTGMSHVATAVATPSVVIASGSDVSRWAPLDEARHRVVWHDVPCRPCMYEQCPTGHECATGVAVMDVLAQAEQLLETQPLYV